MVGLALGGEHVSKHGGVGGLFIARDDGFDDTLVLESRGFESAAREGDAAGLLLEFSHGADHQREDTIPCEIGDGAVKIKVCAHGSVYLFAGFLHGGQQSRELLRSCIGDVDGSATGEFGLNEHARFGKLAQPLLEIRKSAQ